MKRYKEWVVVSFHKWTRPTWNETFMLPKYIKWMFFTNMYMVIASLFPIFCLKVLGILLLIMLFLFRLYLLKYGPKYEKELEKAK